MKKNGPYAYTDIVSSLMNIAQINYKRRKFDDVIDYYSRAVVLLKEFDPTNHVLIATALHWIVHARGEQRLYGRAIEYLQSCLRIKRS